MAAKPKYDWYQTDTAVTITVLLKNAQEKNYSVTVESNSVELRADGTDPLLLVLWNPVDTERYTHKATPHKVEIKLAKVIGKRWESLEQPPTETDPSVSAAAPTNFVKWEKMSRQLDEIEGNDDLTGLFRKIYADANEQAQRAMLKSYYESGGTVLSTNWESVGAGPVEVKAPEGCEFKKWE